LTKSKNTTPKSEIVPYQTEDGISQIQLRAESGTVWLTQREMAELFDVSTDNVGLHLKSIYGDVELRREETTEESSVVQSSSSRRDVMSVAAGH